MAASMTTVQPIQLPAIFGHDNIPKTELADLIDNFAIYHVISNRRSNQIMNFITHPNCAYQLDTHEKISSHLKRITTLAQNHIKFDHFLKSSLNSFSNEQFVQSPLIAQLQIHLENTGKFTEITSNFLNVLEQNDAISAASSASNTDNIEDALNSEFQECTEIFQKQTQKLGKLIAQFSKLQSLDVMDIA